MNPNRSPASFFIPADIPQSHYAIYRTHMNTITRHTGTRLFLFSCDQKIEHMNDDFISSVADASAIHPEHLFTIASQGPIGAMATHLGLIARYGHTYQNIPYIIKLNATTNTISPLSHDPFSTLLHTIPEVITFKKESRLPIIGIGLTIYLGGNKESIMLTQAAHLLFEAHKEGLITIVWLYLRGHAITNETDPHLTAGAVGIANALGADFVKIKMPTVSTAHQANHTITNYDYLKNEIIPAAGNTRVICSGGQKKDAVLLLRELFNQLYQGGTHGCAIGRNIFQRSLPDALALTRAISALVYDNASLEDALIFIQRNNNLPKS